jgi:phage baseplate assembly protein W
MFRNYFKAFLDSNEARGKQGLPLLQMMFIVEKGRWSNPVNESYYVWPESFPMDSRSAGRPHAWDWSISFHILSEGIRAVASSDKSKAVIDPSAAMKKLNALIGKLEKSVKDFKNKMDIVQKIRDVINLSKKIVNGIKSFVQGGKDFIYAVSDLVRSSAQTIQTLLKALDVSAFQNDVNNALRGALYEVRITVGQVQRTAQQWERVGIIPKTLTPPQTASLLRPTQVFAMPGDSLASLAARILGNSGQWMKLVQINNLDYPYLDFSGPNGAADPAYAAAGKRVLGAGEALKIPLPSASGTVALSNDPIGTDLQDYQLQVPNPTPPYTPASIPSEESLVGGLTNLSAAIIRRILTPKGRIPWHPEYGSLLPSFLGTPQELTYIESIRAETDRTLAADSRILAVQSVDARIENDAVFINASVLTALGPLDIAFPMVA